MKAKSFIAALVAVVAAVMMASVMAANAKAVVADPSVTISAAPNPVLIGDTTVISGTVHSTSPNEPDIFESTIYSGAGCVDGHAIAPGPPLSISWAEDLIDGTWSYTSPNLWGLDGYSFGIYYEDDSGYYDPAGSARACVDVAVTLGDDQSGETADDETVENVAVENDTWVCYSHFQDAPMAIAPSRFTYLTTAPQPDLGGKPYWKTGFIPFANKTAADGQAVGNGYYLHCNIAGPSVTPSAWVNNDGMPVTSSDYAAALAEFGSAGVTDPAGKPALFHFYPVVAK